MSRREIRWVALASVGLAVSCAKPATPALPPPPAHSVESAANDTETAGPDEGGGIPAAPRQTDVRAALEPRREDARRCIEPANGPYRLRIVFDSTGAAQNIAMLGSPSPAEDSCIRAAFQKMNVGPFRRATFTLTVTVSAP